MTNITVNQYNNLIQEQLKTLEAFELTLHKLDDITHILKKDVELMLRVNQQTIEDLIEKQI